MGSGDAHRTDCAVSAIGWQRECIEIEPLRCALIRCEHIPQRLVYALICGTCQSAITSGSHVEVLSRKQLHNRRHLPIAEQRLHRWICETRCLIDTRGVKRVAPVRTTI